MIVIIGILATLLIQSFDSLRGKAERAKCESNLRSLFVATASYVEDQKTWPQISTQDYGKPAYVDAWVAALTPYGIARINWICPSAQRAFENIDYVAKPRLDYMPTPFGPEPREPYMYSMQPWFIERGDVHGSGNLMIFTDGKIRAVKGNN